MLKTDDLWTDLKKDAATSTYVNLNTVATTDMHMGNEAWINGESFGSDCVAMSGGSDAYKLKSVGCTSSAKYACMKSGRFLKKSHFKYHFKVIIDFIKIQHVQLELHYLLETDVSNLKPLQQTKQVLKLNAKVFHIKEPSCPSKTTMSKKSLNSSSRIMLLLKIFILVLPKMAISGFGVTSLLYLLHVSLKKLYLEN